MRMRRALTKLAAVGGALALGLTGAAVADEDEGTTVTIASVAHEGSTLRVTGSSTYVDQPYVELATDPAGDSTFPGPTGGDLTAVAVASRLNQTVSFQWTASELSPVAGGTPLLFYAWTFCIDGDDTRCFMLRVTRTPTITVLIGSDPTEPHGELWACTGTIDSSGRCSTWSVIEQITGGVVFDGASNTVTMTLPLWMIFAQPGSKIISAPLRNGCPVSASIHYTNPDSTGGDSICFDTPYEAARRTVSLAVDAPGLAPADVAYTADVSPTGNGGYAAILDVSDLSGRTVYVRACFGSNNCGYATRDVNL